MTTDAKHTKAAKACYEHLGGKLGELLLELFVAKNWIAKENPTDKHFYITEEGEKEFANMGLDLSLIK